MALPLFSSPEPLVYSWNTFTQSLSGLVIHFMLMALKVLKPQKIQSCCFGF